MEDPILRRRVIRDIEGAGSLYGPRFFQLLERASTTIKAATGVTITDPNALLRAAHDFAKSRELWPSGFMDFRDNLQSQLPEAYSILDVKIDGTAVLLASALGSYFTADIVDGKIEKQSGWTEVVPDTSYTAKARHSKRGRAGRYIPKDLKYAPHGGTVIKWADANATAAGTWSPV